MGARHPSGMSAGMRRAFQALETAGSAGLNRLQIAELADLSDVGADYSIKELSKIGAICQVGKFRHPRGRLLNVYAIEESFALRPKCGLWPHEVEVLTWIAAGKTDEDIDLILERHNGWTGKAVAKILDTLGAATRAGAVAIGFRKGILS